MSRDFEVQGATTSGRKHREGLPRNNQDALRLLSRPMFDIVCIADGCGSSDDSEVGAKIGVKLLTQYLQKNLSQGRHMGEMLLERARKHIISRLHPLAEDMGESLSQEVNDNFLFTLGGVVITDGMAWFFCLGDGVFIINGEIIVIDSGKANSPNYLAYDITGSSLTDNHPELLRFRIIRSVPAADLNDFMIGTDGMNKLIKHQHSRLPGSDEIVGHISQFWTQDRYFTRTGLVRRLNLITTDKARGEIMEGGLLDDDIACAVGRRKFPARPALPSEEDPDLPSEEA